MKELRNILNNFTKENFVKRSFYAFYPHKVWNQHALWSSHLPFITPHYAVKSNPEPLLIQTMYQRGIKFDCASLQELKLIKDILPPTINLKNSIVYANPCKSLVDLEYAKLEIGSPTTVVDSREELNKLVDIGYEGGVYVRITTDDKASKIPFSGKFGLSPDDVKDLGYYAKRKNIEIEGISFHVGSGGNNGKIYYNSISTAKVLNKILQAQGHIANTVDIGGGFLSNSDDFMKKVKFIKDAYDPEFQYIAEPGRFFSSVSQDFFVKVIGKKPWSNGWRYTIDDSLYGQFSCIPFDHAKPLWIRVPLLEDSTVRPRTKGLLMGRTCDSVDVIAKSESMEELEVGDWLWFPQMGSYTNATANEFNGFPKPPTIPVHVETEDISNYPERVPETITTVEPVSSAALLY